MISINGNMVLSLDYEFAKIPHFGENEKWIPISEIKMNDVCRIRTSTKFEVIFGIATSLVVTSKPTINDKYVTFTFSDFM